MKFFTMLLIFFLGIFLFFESDEYSMYVKNIEIEKSPIYVKAQISNTKKIEGITTKRGNKFDDSYQLKYKFDTIKGEFYGKTNLLTKNNFIKYMKNGFIEIVYYHDNPQINTVKTYFNEGKTNKIFYQYTTVIAIFSFITSLILSLLFSWKLGWLKRKNKFK